MLEKRDHTKEAKPMNRCIKVASTAAGISGSKMFLIEVVPHVELTRAFASVCMVEIEL